LTTQAKKKNFDAAGRYLRIEAPQVFFFLILIEFLGQIVYNIDTEATNFRKNFTS
jgi:hypothetical protein